MKGIKIIMSKFHVVGPAKEKLQHSKELTLDPHIGGCDDGEDEQKKDEEEALKVVRCHPLHAEQNRLEQLALRRAESIA